jgi:hypothetical protein
VPRNNRERGDEHATRFGYCPVLVDSCEQSSGNEPMRSNERAVGRHGEHSLFASQLPALTHAEAADH